MRKAFNTTIDEEILEDFKEKCKDDGLKVSVVLEQFMKLYIAGEFEMTLRPRQDGK